MKTQIYIGRWSFITCRSSYRCSASFGPRFLMISFSLYCDSISLSFSISLSLSLGGLALTAVQSLTHWYFSRITEREWAENADGQNKAQCWPIDALIIKTTPASLCSISASIKPMQTHQTSHFLFVLNRWRVCLPLVSLRNVFPGFSC